MFSRQLKRSIRCLLIAWASLRGSQLPLAALADDAGPPARLAAGEIRTGIARTHAKVTAIRVTYVAEYPPDEGWPPGTYLRRTVAAMSPGSFFHETAHGHDKLSWQQDPRLRRCFIVADHAVDEWVNNRSYNYTELAPSDGLPGSMPGEFFIHATGFWPLSGRPAPQLQGGPLVLSEVAASQLYRVVRPRQERLDGAWCHVLERPGMDSLWIDPERGFSLIAREARDEKSGHLVERIEMGGHREVKPGLWIPTRIRNTQFDHLAKTAEGRRRRVVDSPFKVVTIELNEDVDVDLFRFHPPPGALWLDPPGGKPVQTSPGGEEQLDRLVDSSRKYSPSRHASSIRTSRRPLIACALILCVAFCLRSLTWRRHMGRPRASTSE